MKISKLIIVMGSFIVLLTLLGFGLFFMLNNKDNESLLKDNVSAVNNAEKAKNNLVKVPYAKMGIRATREITANMIGFVEVNAEYLKSVDIYETDSDVVGLYVNNGTYIPEGGLFFKSQIISKEDLPNITYDDLKEGCTPFSLDVNYDSTYGNSIHPGDRVDIYFKYVDEKDQMIIGKLASKLKVLAVKDNTGKDVFTSEEIGIPAELVIEVEDSMDDIFVRARNMKNAKFVPVPKNKSYIVLPDDVKDFAYLKDFILSGGSKSLTE